MFVPPNSVLMTYTQEDAADLMRLADWLCDAVRAVHEGDSAPELPPEVQHDIAVGDSCPLRD